MPPLVYRGICFNRAVCNKGVDITFLLCYNLTRLYMEETRVMGQITVYRGSHQIGGCATEIATENYRVLIDLGANLPDTENDGLTDDELLQKAFAYNECAVILFTHYHGDHAGLYKKSLQDIPMYIRPTAKRIMEILAETLDFVPGNADKGLPRIQDMRCYTPAEKIIFGDIAVTPFSVDHSALDAYMFLILVGGKRILFTGDFREHGISSENQRLERMLKKYVGEVNILITEGTMLSRVDEKNHNPIATEEKLGKRAAELFSENKQSMFLISSTNLDSIMKFYHALPNDMELVCDLYQAKLMFTLMTDKRFNYGKYRPKFINGKPRRFNIVKTLNDFKAIFPDLQKRGFTVLARENKPLFRDILDMLDDPLIIYLKWTGYLKGKHHDPKITDFIGNHRMKILHTSGHAYVETIEKVIRITKPKKIIPMHTECADGFAELPVFAPYRDKIKVLQYGEIYRFK